VNDTASAVAARITGPRSASEGAQSGARESAARMWRSYGAAGMVRLAIDRVYTLARFPGARLVRRPAYVRGRTSIEFGRGLTTGRDLRIEAFPSANSTTPVIRIGAGVEVNDYVHIAAIQSVTIGDRVLIASRVFISDHQHGSYGADGRHSSPLTPPGRRSLSSAPVMIEDDVWIGEGAAILPGVRIGRGAVIGASAVVTRDVPPFSIAVGAPARVVKSFDFTLGRWEAV
jgi:lipopolysaccharide O-acetyltransferase